MASLIERAGEAAVGAARTVVCGGGGFLLDNLPAIGPTGRAGRELARGLHGALCGLPVPPSLGEPVPSPPPFTGGQCPCATYTVSYTTVNTNPPQTLTGSISRFGPISGPVSGGVVPENPDRLSWGFYYGAEGCGGRRFELLAGGPISAGAGGFTLSINSVVRAGGLPDNCGDPPAPPPIPPPTPPPIPIPPDIDLPVTPPGGGPDVDFNFSPRVGPVIIGVGGGLFIPVNVRINGPNINVNAPISIPVDVSLPDLNISFPGQGGGGGAPDDPAAPSPPGPPPRPIPGPRQPVCCDPKPEPGEEEDTEDGEPSPPPPPGRRLVGLVIRCSIQAGTQSATEIGQGGGDRNLFVPRLANVYFDVSSPAVRGPSVSSSTAPIPVQLLRQYVPAPESVEVRGWRVVTEFGVSAGVTPLYIPANRG